jgi:hypothetical protein
MKTSKTNLSCDRLFQAAEAVMEAVTREAWRVGGLHLQLPDVLGPPDQPKAPEGFTHDEVIEATLFLVRLGYLELNQRRH